MRWWTPRKCLSTSIGRRTPRGSGVKGCYREVVEKTEALFWPASRIVDGNEEFKHVHVHVHDGKRAPLACGEAFVDSVRVHSAWVPFNPRDLKATDGHNDFVLMPDHEVTSLYFHDETTMKENDDGSCQWMSKVKGAAIKEKGKGVPRTSPPSSV